MAYDKGQVAVERLVGGALSGWSAISGVSRTGEADETRQPVDFASVSINDGYTVGDRGELSLDPATATASLNDYVRIEAGGGDPTYGAGPFGAGPYGEAYGGLAQPPINKNDRVEIKYNDVIVLAGLCTEVTVTYAASGEALAHGMHVERRTQVNIASIQRLMLGTVVRWLSLPAESAIDRLRRWFTVDTSAVDGSPSLDVPMEPEDDAGGATLLDIARAFTEATHLPVRPPGVLSPDTWPELEVVALGSEPLPGLDDATQWVSEIEYTNGRPSQLSVITNDTRFTASQEVAGGGALVAFRVPGPIDALGRTVVAHRLTQSFGRAYTAQIEVT